MPSFKTIHPNFKLNNIHYNVGQLQHYAEKLVESVPFEKAIGEFLLDWLNNADTVIVQTSGSTGKPKSITLRKEQMRNSAIATGAFFNLEPEDTALLCLPASYIAGKMMLVRAMVLGLHLICIDPTISSISKIDKKYDFTAMVPLQVDSVLAKLNLFKKIIIGGAPISDSLRERIAKESVAAYETYGMTETITHIAVRRTSNADSGAFKTLPNVHLSLDERNCLVIDAPLIAKHKVVTNDVVELLSETEFKWQGRYDAVINSGGIKLHPEQLEKKFSKHIDVPFFVAGLPDDSLGEKLLLLLEAKSNTKIIKESLCNDSDIDRYEIPKQIICLESFVYTPNGKIQRTKTLENL